MTKRDNVLLAILVVSTIVVFFGFATLQYTFATTIGSDVSTANLSSTGNLVVGNGIPSVTQDGEDAYIEGTLEVDGATRLDGALTLAGNFTPSANDGVALGVSGTAWSDLFLASGSVINLNAGDITLTHSANTLTVGGGSLSLTEGDVTLARSATGSSVAISLQNDDNTNASSHASISLATAGSSGGDPFIAYSITGDATYAVGIDNTDNSFQIANNGSLGSSVKLHIISGAVTVNQSDADVDFIVDSDDGTQALKVDAGLNTGAGAVIFGSVPQPSADDGVALGVSGTAWSDLFLASGAVVNFAGDITLTHSSNILAFAGGHFFIGDDLDMRYGLTTANPGTRIGWESSYTNDYFNIGVVDSRNVIISEDLNVNWAHATQTNPTLWIHSSDGADTSDFINFTHDQTNAVIDVGNGGVSFTASTMNAKGTDVASAGDVTLGNDGNYFDVTGTSTINTIIATGWTAGSIITLQFDGSLTVKHNTAGGGASILLSGAVDFAATANDTLTLVYDGATWREVARTAI